MTAPLKYLMEAVRLANLERGDHALTLADAKSSHTLRALARVLYENDLPVHDPADDEAGRIWDEVKAEDAPSFALLSEATQHHLGAFYRRIKGDCHEDATKGSDNGDDT